MTSTLSHGAEPCMLCNLFGSAVLLYFLFVFSVSLVRAAWGLLARLTSLLMELSNIAGQALALAAAWPFEIALDQSEKWIAIGIEWREQRKIWRKEFRKIMPWDEFRRQMTGQPKVERDDYADALSLFGLAEPFTRQEMDARFKRIMQGVHPDTGGSDYLAQQVTAARALVLKRKGWKK
ncbi:hypothetical protein QEV83_14490 [Methylocapsa sp. D3K7]|uniref:hypothetical protein n=1 Tax=Methylocapsa sp. D3K7 TaxID=3041435 RepID=UPI00244ECB25|nr:hypothetical protein [Methylocapsa sp. D3K7]WGJ13869.1 hypothetical protein QEV83_14490 [Methylocapsa sp. D3K7]